MMSGVSVPSLVTLPEVEVLTLNFLRLLTEPGGCWFSELFEVQVEVVDLGCVVISEPMEALPLSELALQLPLEEWGSSLPARLCRLCVELSLSLTATFITDDSGVAMGRLILDFSEEDSDGFRSWFAFRSLVALRDRFIVTVS